MGFVVDVAWVVNLMQEARELAAIKPRPAAAIQAGEEFELAACGYRHENAGMRKQETSEQLREPLHLLHAGELPAAVGADIDPRLQALRFRDAAHLQAVRL